MRRITALIALLALLLALTACGGSGQADQAQTGPVVSGEGAVTQLTLWTFPVGGWGSSGTLSSMLAAFHREHPDIRVSARDLTYDDGDAIIEQAVEEGGLPDLVLEGPERLVANWGDRGLMAPLNDLWQEPAAGAIYDTVRDACHDGAGTYYIYPLCMTTHCMAVNRDLFEAAGAWQYIDEQSHTWTTDGFVSAVKALHDAGVENAAAVYCGGQTGDQGTRALVNNLYGGAFTNPEHTAYTAAGPENARALALLAGLEGVRFDASIGGSDEIKQFAAGELAMAFCWNVFQEVNQVVSNPDLDFDIFPMAFPTDSGAPRLQGGIWGFGVFDNGDQARIDAAKEFIRFMTGDDAQYTRAVLASTYWPVRDLPDIYANDQLMNEYGLFQQYLGDYYQVTPGWAGARTAWWNMLQRVGQGEDPATALEEFDSQANAAAADSGG